MKENKILEPISFFISMIIFGGAIYLVGELDIEIYEQVILMVLMGASMLLYGFSIIYHNPEWRRRHIK